MNDELTLTAERLAATAALLEQAVARLDERQNIFADAEATIGRIVATVESRREAELEAKLAATEQKIAELQAAAASATTGRKTLPAATQNLLAKQGVAVESIEAGALDAALSSLSMEQRVAVKAQLLRAGLVG